MKYDLTSDSILCRPVMKVKYINNYKAVFDFKQMGLFLIYQVMWALGGLSNMDPFINEICIGTLFLYFSFKPIGDLKDGVIPYYSCKVIQLQRQ